MDSLVVWSGVMVACIVVEILTVSLVSVWFVIGAFAALIACLLNVSVPIQVAIFLVVSVICAIVARPMAVKSLKGNIIHTNNDALIVTHALVINKICFTDPAAESAVSWDHPAADCSAGHEILRSVTLQSH